MLLRFLDHTFNKLPTLTEYWIMENMFQTRVPAKSARANSKFDCPVKNIVKNPKRTSVSAGEIIISIITS